MTSEADHGPAWRDELLNGVEEERRRRIAEITSSTSSGLSDWECAWLKGYVKALEFARDLIMRRANGERPSSGG